MYKIVKNSYIWLIISGVLMLASIFFIAFWGLRVGIDYRGGTVIEFTSDNANHLNLAKEALADAGYSNYTIQDAGNKIVTIKMPLISNEAHVSLVQTVKTKLPDYSEVSYDSVGAIISRDLIVKSIWAVVLSSLGIIFYIAFAFRKIPRPLSSWKFGASAVIALIHDLLITTGAVAVIGHFLPWMEVDALFLTALLTIMGFSVHDTIVVYDRLRENFIKNPHRPISEIAEESVNQTLVRSINTSLTVIIVLLSLFLLGGGSVRHFVLTLIIGVFFGTYSSIFVATAITVAWHKKIATN